MGNVTRLRVELRDCPHNASREEKERAFRSMFSAFKRLYNESGIASEWKNKQFYESPGEKNRRKKKESALEREKAKLRDHFSNRRGNNNGR